MIDKSKPQFHLRITAADAGPYALMPGDPGRCEKIAKLLDDPVHIGTNREYDIWRGTLDGERVVVCSHGIGGPSTAIAAEELAACGVRTMIRIGTCGGIALKVRSGDVVIASGAVRYEGTSREYAPIEFPAVPDTDVLFALKEAADKLGFTYHVGVVQCKDSFYGQHSPETMPTYGELTYKWEAWKKLGVLCSEMESAALFTAGAARNLRTGSVFHVIWNQERFNAGLDTGADEDHDTSKPVKIATEALRILIAHDKGKKPDERRHIF